MRRRWLRLLLAAALVAVAGLQVDGLVRTFRGEARVRDQALRVARETVLGRREALAGALAPGGEAASRAGAVLMPLELFDGSRRALFASPEPAEISHWPAPGDLELIR